MEKYFKREYLLLLLFITFLPTIIYFLKFVCSDITATPETWAQFGDFIGGTTNVILGIINILITTYIAYLIKSIDDTRFNEQKELENQRFNEQKELENLRHSQSLELQNNLFLNQTKYY